MDPHPDTPDPRFLAGVELFNRGEFFAAHEVWEDLWRDCPAAERRFYQALIQAAVAAYHWGRGNAAGARRLYHSGRRYMDPFRPVCRGLAVDAFWDALAAHLAGALGGPATSDPPPRIELR
jgi:predicted metal-dependent hydrolase